MLEICCPSRCLLVCLFVCLSLSEITVHQCIDVSTLLCYIPFFESIPDWSGPLDSTLEFPCSSWATGLEDLLFLLLQICYYSVLFNRQESRQDIKQNKLGLLLFFLHHGPLFVGLCLYWKFAWKERDYLSLKSKLDLEKQNLRAVRTLVTHWHGHPFGHLHIQLSLLKAPQQLNRGQYFNR